MPVAPTAVSWSEAVEVLARQSGVVMLVGATDVGKTTLTLAAANLAVREGRKAAILDMDVGQGEIGPPGTIGIVRLEEPAPTLSDLQPRALAFVGAVSPAGHLLSLVQAARRLVSHALRRQDDVVFVDTSGLVAGRMAEKLKLTKLAVLEPDLLVIVQRNDEISRLAALLATSTSAAVLYVQSPSDMGRKSTVYRKFRRANRMRRHFSAARVVDLDAGQVKVVDAWLYTGTPLAARQLRFAAQALKTDVPHGEVTADGLFLCAMGRPDPGGMAALQEEFRRKKIGITAARALGNLLVGMVEEGGRLVDIGLLQGVNFERALFSILTPARSVAEVRQLHFGRLRLRPDGAEIAHLRPGDL